MNKPQRVMIIGGTHGNEWTGIKLVQHYQDYFLKKFPQLNLEFILGNPKAYEINCRFKDEDLNRAFEFLNENRSTYEHQRAKELKSIITKSPCLLIDLHTTTANMGSTLIITNENPLIMRLCAEITENNKDIRIISAPDPNKKYLVSQSEFSLMIEVGPVANGLINAHALESSQKLLELIFNSWNSSSKRTPGPLEIYEEIEDIYYPSNDKGEILGHIHSELQGKDFVPLIGKFKAFKNFHQEDLEMELTEERYPIFINEAAYYPKRLAFTLCQKRIHTFKVHEEF